jgi:hypothetical protein
MCRHHDNRKVVRPNNAPLAMPKRLALPEPADCSIDKVKLVLHGGNYLIALSEKAKNGEHLVYKTGCLGACQNRCEELVAIPWI